MDVSVVSARTNLSVNAYRQLENGTIKMAKIRNFSEIATKKRGNTLQNNPVRKEKTTTIQIVHWGFSYYINIRHLYDFHISQSFFIYTTFTHYNRSSTQTEHSYRLSSFGLVHVTHLAVGIPAKHITPFTTFPTKDTVWVSREGVGPRWQGWRARCRVQRHLLFWRLSWRDQLCRRGWCHRQRRWWKWRAGWGFSRHDWLHRRWWRRRRRGWIRWWQKRQSGITIIGVGEAGETAGNGAGWAWEMGDKSIWSSASLSRSSSASHLRLAAFCVCLVGGKAIVDGEGSSDVVGEGGDGFVGRGAPWTGGGAGLANKQTNKALCKFSKLKTQNR
jgi:hypothetical protein